MVRAPIFDQERCRTLMEKGGIDLILASSSVNVGYLSGLFTHMPSWETASIMHVTEKEYDKGDLLLFAGFPYDPERASFLVLYHHTVDAIKNLPIWVEDVKGYSRNTYKPKGKLETVPLEPASPIFPLDCVVEAIKERSLETSTIGVERCRIPYSVLAELKNRLPQAKFVDAFNLLFELRSVKTPEEIDRLQKAFEIDTKVVHEIFKMFRVGATPYEIFQKGLEIIYQERGVPTFYHVFTDFGGGHYASYNAPPDKKFQKGQIGVFDLGVGYKGYHSDICTALVMGRANDKVKRVYSATLGARQAIQRAIKPGIRACELFKIGANYLESKGLYPSISLMGHGIGLNCHELPFLLPNDHTVIKPGMTICIEIPVIEAPGLAPLALEDGGVVTEEGWESFTSVPTELKEILE